MEVPTPVSFSLLLQWTVEQNVDIPAAGGSGACGGLSGFLPGQNSAALWNRTVHVPSGGGLQGFQRGQSSTAFLEQITVSPNPGGGLQIFQPVQCSAAISSVSPGHAGEGFFRTFPQMKKVRHYLRTPGRLCLRTRAHGRRRLVACRWCSRRRRSRSWMRRRRLKRLLWRCRVCGVRRKVVGATVGPDGAAVLLVARCG